MSDYLVKDTHVVWKKFGETTVYCIIIHDFYTKEHYAEDVEELRNYQLKLSNEEEGDTDLRKWNITHYTAWPTYATFRDSVNRFLPLLIFETIDAQAAALLAPNKDCVVPDELCVQMKLRRVANRDWYSAFFEDIKDDMMQGAYVHNAVSTEEDACYDIAGLWLLQTIALPLSVHQRIDFSHAFHYFMHEFTHFIQFNDERALPENRREMYYQKQMKNTLVRRQSAYELRRLYQLIFELWTEGMAEFNARTQSDSITIDLNGIMEFNQRVRVLAETAFPTGRVAYDYWNDAISTGNNTSSGDYANGRTMVLIIALALARELKKPYTIITRNETLTAYAPDLERLMSDDALLKISNLHPDVIAATLEVIAKTPHFLFLKLYEKKCDELGISDEHRIMTRKRFLALADIARKNGERRRQLRLLTQGFAAPNRIIAIDG